MSKTKMTPGAESLREEYLRERRNLNSMVRRAGKAGFFSFTEHYPKTQAPKRITEGSIRKLQSEKKNLPKHLVTFGRKRKKDGSLGPMRVVTLERYRKNRKAWVLGEPELPKKPPKPPKSLYEEKIFPDPSEGQTWNYNDISNDLNVERRGDQDLRSYLYKTGYSEGFGAQESWTFQESLTTEKKEGQWDDQKFFDRFLRGLFLEPVVNVGEWITTKEAWDESNKPGNYRDDDYLDNRKYYVKIVL